MANSSAQAGLGAGFSFAHTMGGIFWFQFSQLGFNFFAGVFGLDLTIKSWENFAASLEQYTQYLRDKMNDNITFSEVEVFGGDNGIGLIDLYKNSIEMGTPIEDTVAYMPFAQNGIPAQQDAARAAFQLCRDKTTEILALLEGEYVTKAAELRSANAPGLAAPNANPVLKDVEYPFALQVIANTPFNAEQIHALGLEQTALIQHCIVQVSNEFILPPSEQVADWNEFISRFRDPNDSFSSYFEQESTVGEFLDEINALIFEAYGNATLAFQHFNRSPVVVERFPGFSAANYDGPIIGSDGTGTVTLTNGMYNQPTQSNNPEINLNDVITVPKSFTSSTVYHEAIPGHHFQISLLIELPCKIAAGLTLGAAEGWALYAEQVAANDMLLALPEENPQRAVDFFCPRLLRAVRLVVDTGLHNLGWGRQEVVDYMLNNTLLAEPFIQAEADRYTTWPGQACGYLLGSLQLDQQRSRAESLLGEEFNLPEYHDVLIRYLAPVELLIQQLTDFYVGQKIAGTFDQVWPPITRQPAKQPLNSVLSLNQALDNAIKYHNGMRAITVPLMPLFGSVSQSSRPVIT